jgi:protein-tyrosine-phosphatase/DNA-binding HxlR family transcriptional regulator
MNLESDSSLARRAAIYAALGDPARLRIVDILTTGDAAPSELIEALGMPSNLLAHHLKVLREVGLVSSHRSQGDGRRQYLRLAEHTGTVTPHAVPTPTPTPTPARVVFVCTANSARSHLAAALWRRNSDVPSASAGTHPAARIDPGAIEAAGRHDLPLPRLRPRALADVIGEGDLVITVCDLAHEELGVPHELHWSIPDPVRVGTTAAFDAALDEIEGRVRALAPRLAS